MQVCTVYVATSAIFRVEGIDVIWNRTMCTIKQREHSAMYSIAKSTVFRVERVKCNQKQGTVYYEQQEHSAMYSHKISTWGGKG